MGEQLFPWEVSAPTMLGRATALRAAAEAQQLPDTNLIRGVASDQTQREFVNRLIEILFGTEDAFTTAMSLREASQDMPDGMSTRDRLLIRAGGTLSLGLPWLVKSLAQRHLLDRAADLVVPVRLPARGVGKLTGLSETLRQVTDDDLVPVVQLLGDDIHGPEAAAAEAERLAGLCAHSSVRRLVVDPQRLVPGTSDWSIDADVHCAATMIRPILEAAAEHGVTVIIDPGHLRWARVMPTLIERLLGSPAATTREAFERETIEGAAVERELADRLQSVHLGVRIAADLPESRDVYAQLHCFAQQRVAHGGAPLEVIIGRSQFAARERIHAILTGLPVQVIEDPIAAQAQMLRLVELALHAGRAAVLRPVIATEDPRMIAAAIELAAHAGSSALYAIQLRSGVSSSLARVLPGEVPEVQVRIPLLPRGEYGGATNLLIELIAEHAPNGSDHRSSGAHDSSPDAPDVDTDAHGAGGTDADADDDFCEAVALAAEPAVTPHRTQHRAREWDPSERDSALFYRAPDETSRHDTGGLTAAVLGLDHHDTGEITLTEFAPAQTIPVVSRSGFANEPRTDAALEVNRTWARDQLRKAATIAEERVAEDDTVALSPADLDPNAAAAAAREAAAVWSGQSHAIRAVRLRRAALATAAARDRCCIEFAAATGDPITTIDAQITHIIDAARYAAQLAESLQGMRGATFVPDQLVLVVGDHHVHIGVQAAAVLSALAAGSGVLWVVPEHLVSAALACVEEWEVGGLTPDAVRVVGLGIDETLTALGASPHVDRAVVLGDRRLGRELAQRRPDLRVDGHFVSRGSLLITPTASHDCAITDLVDSAFRADGTVLAHTRMAVLLASVGRSRAFKDGLADAVRALRVGDTRRPDGADPLAFDVGPLTRPPSERELRALTELNRGEEWLVQPRQLDDAGLLWSPGVRLGVSARSTFWEDAVGVPVLGIVQRSMLAEAIELQNSPGTGTAAGLQSWDETEIEAWLTLVSAATLGVNRTIGSARIERQPTGSWNDAAMGLPALTGGPHWLVAQGSWSLRPGTRSDTLHLRGLDPEIGHLIELLQSHLTYEAFDELRRAALDDQLTWRTMLGEMHDDIGLGIERNVRRASPVPVHVRQPQGNTLGALARVLAAALLVRAPIELSTGEPLPSQLHEFLAHQGVDVSLETDTDWLERIAVTGPTAGQGVVADRVRLLGGDRVRVAEWMGGLDRTALWAEPVTMAGPVELLVFVREQAISARAERHGLAHAVPGLDPLLS